MATKFSERALEELKEEAERNAISRAKDLIRAITQKQKELNQLRKDLANIEIPEYNE